jgi:dolichol kinase
MPTVAPALAPLARDVHALLHDLQDRSRPVPADRARTLADRAREAAMLWKQDHPKAAAHLGHLSERLDALSRDRTHLWRAAKNYEGFARMLRTDPQLGGDAVDLPELRPNNLKRSLFHIGNGFFAATLYTVFDDRALMLTVAAAYASWMVTLEIARRFNPRLNRFLVDRVFGSIARPSEAWRMNSATWYGLAILVMLALPVPRASCIAAVLALGVGDPAAAWVGRRWGTLKILGRKSLQGTLAFAVAATLVVGFWALGFLGFDPMQSLVFALVSGVAGAIAEGGSGRLEDNVTIPLAVAGATALVL